MGAMGAIGDRFTEPLPGFRSPRRPSGRRYFKASGLPWEAVESLDPVSHSIEVATAYPRQFEGAWDKSAQPGSFSFSFRAARTFSAVMGRSRIRTPTAS